MTRREIIVASAGFVGYLTGKPIAQTSTAQQQQLRNTGLRVALDEIGDGIVFVYRGQRAVLTPEMIMAALNSKGDE